MLSQEIPSSYPSEKNPPIGDTLTSSQNAFLVSGPREVWEGDMTDSEDPVAYLLHTLGNPIRKATIRALKEGEMRFSHLMAACGLDYDHDAGHFCYHLSELIERGVVEKSGEAYHLTESGSKTAELLDYLDREFSFLFTEEEGGEEHMKDIDLQTEWVGQGGDARFERRSRKGLMSQRPFAAAALRPWSSARRSCQSGASRSLCGHALSRPFQSPCRSHRPC